MFYWWGGVIETSVMLTDENWRQDAYFGIIILFYVVIIFATGTSPVHSNSNGRDISATDRQVTCVRTG